MAQVNHYLLSVSSRPTALAFFRFLTLDRVHPDPRRMNRAR